MKTDKVGLYVHIPFCAKKCNYCDFCSFADIDSKTRDVYIDKLCQEIHGYSGQGIEIDTIFFGGGTPTLLSVDEFEKIVNSIKNSFVILDNVEFTVEANPGTTSKDKIESFIKHGANRFSIGLQSIHENELKILGRIHTFEGFLKTFHDMRDAGVSNINVDLMYGIPEQTKESFKKTLETVASLSPEHLSVYGLILEDGTPFYKMKDVLMLPSEDDECDMYFDAVDFLTSKGYTHYEISNYAKDGFYSNHNLKYWKDKEYIGIGVSAYSYFKDKRYGNTRSFAEYITNSSPIEYSEVIDENTEKYEYVMLSLRLKEGFALDDYKKRFDENFLTGREDVISKLSENGYLLLENGRISLTDSGFYISNHILTELL